MKATKSKTPPVYGDDLPITAFQIKRIRQNSNYNEDIKEEWVQWVTGDVNRTSLTKPIPLTQAQAVKIIKAQTGQEQAQSENWGFFDNENQQHKTLMSLLRQAQWTIPNERWNEVPDLIRLSSFLKSDKSPINKPLKKMEPWEVSKIIEAFKGIVKSTYK
jgi:hypothetical protein